MNISEEASLIRQLEEARAVINQRNGEILRLQRESERYREQRDSANAMVQFLQDLFENGVALQPNQSVIVLNHAYEHLRICDYCHKTHDDRLACPSIKNAQR
ncbi:hypothetical protein [Raoultella sp. HC6]|uniref:hypothetical protein n=1 Tax=Raoultella sp. HC6 TaxID=2923366 RepID=UPI001F509893|nr:hypothetical protein [Raoultella sp. HC6]